MTENKTIAQPKLAKPGAGLPFIEWAIAKYILIPRLLKSTDKKKALAYFALESKKIIAITDQLDPNILSQRRLIPKLRGLEDNSRYYSIAMTLHHLILINDFMRKVILGLSVGDIDLPLLGVADFKPAPDIDAHNILSTYQQICERFLQEISAADIDAFTHLTYPHPWFGALNAFKWLAFAGPHQNIHRQQIKAIIVRL